MPPDERQFLLCTGEIVRFEKLAKFPHAHVVAELDYRFDEELGRKVPDLAIFRMAFPADDVPSKRPAVAAYVPTVRKVLCSLCERAAKWTPTNQSFGKLMQRYER